MRARSESIAAQVSLFNELLSAVAEPAMREARISPSVFELLSAISAGRNKETQAQIARRMGITPPSLSEAVRTVVEANLVEQRPSETDRRKKVLALTRAGSAAVNKVLRAIASAEEELAISLTPQEIHTAVEILKRANVSLAKRVQRECDL